MKRLDSPQSLNAAVKSICDIMRRSNCAGALQYVPELTWILFLRILDHKEEEELQSSAAVGAPFQPSLAAPYRWRDWAAPYDIQHFQKNPGDKATDGWKRFQLFETEHRFKEWVDTDLVPHIKGLKNRPGASVRQKVLSEIFSGVEKTRIDTDRNLLDILDKVHEIDPTSGEQSQVFTLSQIYEGLLLKMGEKGNDGGQFFTPREVIRALVLTVDPKIGETVYDPGCGTGGFLAQSYAHMKENRGSRITPQELEILKRETFYGREKDNHVYPIALANLVLHEIDEPHIWHGNTLTGGSIYEGLYNHAPSAFDVILMNPPFGGKESKEAQTQFTYKTGATEVLFLQHVIDRLKTGGRCGIVMPEGVLFRTNETAFVQTKRKLLGDCDLWCIVSLPSGVFTQAGAGVKTNLLFFTKGKPTERVWYYDLSDLKIRKKTPLLLSHFDEFFRLLPDRSDGPRSWSITRKEIEQRNFDLKAVNPNSKPVEDTRTPAELLDLIEAKGREVAEIVERLRVGTISKK